MIHYKLFSKRAVLITIAIIMGMSSVWVKADTLQGHILEQAKDKIDHQDEYAQSLIEKIDSIQAIPNLSDSAFVTFVIRDLGNYYRRQGEQSNAIEIFSEAVGLLEKKKSNPELLQRLYLPLGAAFEEIGLWSSAMEYYHKALHIAEDNNLQDDIARIYNNIGAAYYRTDLEKAEEYINNSLNINTKLGDKQELFLNYNNLAAIYIKQDNYQEALDYALQALQMIDKKKNADMYHVMLMNISTLYLTMDDLNLATSYLYNALEYFNETGNLSELTTVYTYLIEAEYKRGNRNIAIQYAEKIENELIHKIDNSELESRTRNLLAEFYHQIDNHDKAYHNLHKASVIKDSLYNVNDARKLNNLERIYDNEQALRENALIINEMQINKLKSDRSTTVIVIALVVLIIIVIFLVIRYRLQSKLIITNAQLAEQQLALQEKEKEIQLIKEQELNQAIDRKNRELSSYALSYTRDNEFMANLSEELKQVLIEINPRDKEHKEHIRNILTQLKQHCSADNWQEFRYYFEQVHPSFYDRLEELSPGITQRQKRLCAMLYIGLTTKEISSITFREVRSIESARNRLRKKLDVPADETIQEFLSHKLGNPS